MYASWWFQTLLLMLVVNIVICSIDRLQTVGKTIFVRYPTFDLQAFRNRKSRREFDAHAPAETLQSPFKSHVAKSFRYCKVVPTDNGYAITAEKGRWTRLGVYAVHLSVVVMLVGGVIGSRYGFEGFVPIPEGETADTIRLHSTGEQKRLPFVIRCNSFTVEFYEGTRRPKVYRSDLTILKNGQEVLHKEIEVNDPLYFNRIGIFQSSYGRMDDRAPVAASATGLPKEITLHLRSAASGMNYTRTVEIGQVIDIPENLGHLVIERFEPDADFRGMALGPALIARLNSADGEPQTVILPFQYPRFDTMRGGDIIITVEGGGGAEPRQERYYTGLQVSYDPGVPVVYTGFVLMILGCWVAFFMSHQRVVVEVSVTGARSRVMVSGTANKNKMGFRDTLQNLTEQLEALTDRGNQR